MLRAIISVFITIPKVRKQSYVTFENCRIFQRLVNANNSGKVQKYLDYEM